MQPGFTEMVCKSGRHSALENVVGPVVAGTGLGKRNVTARSGPKDAWVVVLGVGADLKTVHRSSPAAVHIAVGHNVEGCWYLQARAESQCALAKGH